MESYSLRQEISLDPSNWDDLRALGHRMLDDMLDQLQHQHVGDGPVWKPIPAEAKASLAQPLPTVPQDAAAVYEEFLTHILPNPMGNTHPRFWGWVIGTGTPLGMLAEMLAAGMNPNVGGGDHIANYVEAQVLDWCKAMLGYPAESSGLLVSGGSMANLVGLTVARNARAGYDIRKEGLSEASHRMTCYASAEAHSSIQKAVELLGMGSDSLRKIPVNADFQIDIPALERAITQDRAAGLLPIAVVGNAGTVNTGAFDDLNALADIAAREELWFHVDGAFGALTALSPELKPLVSGMERADSVGFDLHKWLYMPMEIGCALVRCEPAHRHTFALSPDYLAHGARGLAGGSLWFSEYGVQLSRGFRALKAWMSFKTYGINTYGQLIQQNVDQARYLAERVDAVPELERLAPVPLNIVCFRYVVPGLAPERLNALNEELLLRLHESGVAAPSYTKINGQYAIRAAITNHRSRCEDFDIMLDKVLELGHVLAAEMA
ncbi:MAG: amino acid decarboxylase [Anaerolineae bacterium]|nr:amino acid decarboxylase [Anaerolineae bacterium]